MGGYSITYPNTNWRKKRAEKKREIKTNLSFPQGYRPDLRMVRERRNATYIPNVSQRLGTYKRLSLPHSFEFIHWDEERLSRSFLNVHISIAGITGGRLEVNMPS